MWGVIGLVRTERPALGGLSAKPCTSGEDARLSVLDIMPENASCIGHTSISQALTDTSGACTVLMAARPCQVRHKDMPRIAEAMANVPHSA